MDSPQDRHTSQPHFRMQLNNHLQAIRGTERLRWGKPIKSGPDNSPSWSITAFLDGREFGPGTGANLDAAKEEAARQVLRHLLALSFKG